MQRYKTLTEVKKNLPEILDRIDFCKRQFNSCTRILEKIQNWCVEETVDPTKNYGWWTTLSAYSHFVKQQMEFYAEMEYLQDLVNRLPKYKEQYF